MGAGGLFGGDGVVRLDGIVDRVMFGTNFTNPLSKAIGGWTKKHHQDAKTLQGFNQKDFQKKQKSG